MRRAVVLALLTALAGATEEARADAQTVAQARVYYDAGTQAYAAGRYLAAVEAFTEAYRLLDKPPILFSLAQAERRQYTVSLNLPTLRAAILHFRKYITQVLQDERRADAVSAIEELEAIAARGGAPGSAEASATSPQAIAPTTRVMISTATKGALVVLDDKEYTDVPVIEPVKPGKHAVRVSAPGYGAEERELFAVEGTLVPLEVVLTEKPSFLELDAPPGASVMVDGRPCGKTPLAAIDVKAGSHVVVVTQTGHTPYVGRVTAARGQTTRLRATLPRTGQRTASYVLAGSGAGTLTIGAALAIAAVGQEATLRDLHEIARRRNLDAAQVDTYNAALATRNDLKRDAWVSAGIAGAVMLAAVGLYLFDNPTPLPADSARSSSTPKVSFTLGPTGITGRF